MLIVVQKFDEPMVIGGAVVIIRVDGPDRVRVCVDGPRDVVVERTALVDRKLGLSGFVRYGDVVYKDGRSLSVREALESC